MTGGKARPNSSFHAFEVIDRLARATAKSPGGLGSRGVRGALPVPSYVNVCGWRRGHLAHGDLLRSLTGPVSKPTGSNGRALCRRPADGHAGSGGGQLHPTGRAPSSPRPRITGPGLKMAWEREGLCDGAKGGRISFPDFFAELTFPLPWERARVRGKSRWVQEKFPLIRPPATFSQGRRKGVHSGDKGAKSCHPGSSP
jgi:hypothetical protein